MFYIHVGHFGKGGLFITFMSTLECVFKKKHPFANKKEVRKCRRALNVLKATSTKVVKNGAFSSNANEFISRNFTLRLTFRIAEAS